ncbi:MAG: hypothetical protein ACKPAE_17885, partial [Microcystis panniformis]
MLKFVCSISLADCRLLLSFSRFCHTRPVKNQKISKIRVNSQFLGVYLNITEISTAEKLSVTFQ